MNLSGIEGNGRQIASRVGKESPLDIETDCRVL